MASREPFSEVSKKILEISYNRDSCGHPAGGRSKDD
jgi:hypothetical protein